MMPVDALLVDEELDTEVVPVDTQPMEANSLLVKMKNKSSVNEVIPEINEDNANSCDEDGNTPLHLLGEYYLRTSEICQKLFVCKANIHQQNHNGDTPLHSAARHNKISLITDLRNKGANTKTTNDQNKLPQDLATSAKAINQLTKEWDYQKE